MLSFHFWLAHRALYPGLTHAHTHHHGLVVPDIIAISENCPNLNFPFSFQSTRFKERLSRSLKEASCRTLLPVSLLPHLVLVMANLVLVLAPGIVTGTWYWYWQTWYWYWPDCSKRSLVVSDNRPDTPMLVVDLC